MKSIGTCQFGNCTNQFKGYYLCKRCGKVVCRDHYDHNKSLCLSCAAPSEGECNSAAIVGVLVGIALVIGVVVLIYNLIPKPQPPPWQVTLTSNNAQHSGTFDNNDPNNVNGAWSELQAGASLTYTGITPPTAGTYTLGINGDGGASTAGWTLTDGSPSKQDYTLSVLVNGNLQATFHLTEGSGSTQPVDVPLQAGQNTIQLKLEGHDDVIGDSHTYVIISLITLAQKTT